MTAYAGRFAGRTAVVTGGASGLGKASAARIVAEGGKVVLWDLNADALKAAAEEVGATHVVALDVSDADAVAAAAEESNKALGKIDILIASAGITGTVAPVMPAEAIRMSIRPSILSASAAAAATATASDTSSATKCWAPI